MKKCNCGGEMVQGFIPDFGSLAAWATVWLPGNPNLKKSFLERVKSGGGVSVDSSEALALEAHRCDQCGMVQLYANSPVAVGTSPAS